jgi:hypothetical protein
MQTLGGLRTPPTNTTHKAKNPTKKKRKRKESLLATSKGLGCRLLWLRYPLSFLFLSSSGEQNK